MKEYRDKTSEVVTKRECVTLTCDLCGEKAKHPTGEEFTWGGVGYASGTLSWYWWCDGEHTPSERDLCYECADALGETISNPVTKNDLLALIGCELRKPGN